MDMKNVVKLVELMEAHGLDEVEVTEGDLHIRLKKGGTQLPHPPAAAPVTASLPVAAAPPPNGADAAGPNWPPKEKNDLVEIPSPMVGTFFRSPSPDAASFVEEGDKVAPASVICIIEAMKVMNEIKAEVEGEIVSILVENGESVEYGQPLMTIRPPASAS